MGNDERVPDVPLHSYGYMYLADNEPFADILRECQVIQANCGAGTKIMTPEEIKRDYPFYKVDDIVAGSHNRIDEGYFDGNTLFDWWSRSARERGTEYIANEVVGMALNKGGSKGRIRDTQIRAGCYLRYGGQCLGPAGNINLPAWPVSRSRSSRANDTPIFLQRNSLWIGTCH